MGTSMAALSRRLFRSLLLSNPKPFDRHYYVPMRFCTTTDVSLSASSDSDESDSPNSVESDSPVTDQSSSSSSKNPNSRRPFIETTLENGLDMGVYKAILVGLVGQKPLQKVVKSGKILTLFSVGTGGIRNNRRPLENENPREYAERCSVQWHRVCVYPEKLGDVVMKNAVIGSILYLEGNLEKKIFSDPVTGLVRHIREIAIRQNSRIVFLGKGSGVDESTQPGDLKRLGYY